MTSVRTIGRNLEKWNDIIEKLEIDLSKPVNLVTAKKVREFSGIEARIMAKIDSLSDLPKVFKDNNLIILPVSRKEYALVKGKGYQVIEDLSDKHLIHYSEIPIDYSKSNESYYLDYAFSSGIISKLARYKFDQLYLTGRGRHMTNFSFKLSEQDITVKGAQIEIDGQYENAREIMIFEAKLKPITSFNIRQLYYPFRHLRNKNEKKEIRTFLFNVDLKNQVFKFWEYVFDPPQKLDSIKLIDFYSFKIKIKRKLSKINIKPKPEKIELPQADDIEKVFLIVEQVNQGNDNAKKISQALKFVPRQSNYYRHAGELLGIIRLQKPNYEITERGYEYLRSSVQDRKNFILKLMLEFPIINEIFNSLISNQVKEFKREDIVNLLKKKSSLGDSTVDRRTRTIVSWFSWIEKNNGYVKVIDRKIIVSNVQKALDEKPISDRIKDKENLSLEFKSSFRYDIELNKLNPKILEKSIIKTIAAFMNSEGGDLLLGVDDNGNALGLDNDYRFLKKKNSDGFELEFRQTIDKYIKNRIANEFVKLKFHIIDGKEICEVKILPTPVPIFLTGEDGKNECYVRIGNSSKPYNYEEFYQYCNRHFKKVV
jgi:hypothetical protein